MHRFEYGCRIKGFPFDYCHEGAVKSGGAVYLSFLNRWIGGQCQGRCWGRLGVDIGSLGGCLDGVCVVGVDGIGSYQASGVFQAC